MLWLKQWLKDSGDIAKCAVFGHERFLTLPKDKLKKRILVKRPTAERILNIKEKFKRLAI